MNLATALLETLARRGEATAITEANGANISCATLHRWIRALAAKLRERGVAPGDDVVIQVPNGSEFVAAAVATLAVGGRAILCEPGLGDAVYFARLRTTSPRWVLVHPLVTWANRLPGARALLRRREVQVPPRLPAVFGAHHLPLSQRTLVALARSLPSTDETVTARADTDDALVLFTGGTSRMPKGVRLSHGAVRGMLDNIRGIAADLPITRFLADTPQQVLYALTLGKQVLVTRGRAQRRARFVLRAIREGRADAYFGSPYLWVEMMAAGAEQDGTLPASLGAILLGGAPVTPAFLERLRAWRHPKTAVRAIYGLTEAGPVCCATDMEKIAWSGGGDYAGRLLPGIRAAIEDPGADGVGEVVLYGDTLYTGYSGQPDRGTAGLRTGDLGRLIPVDDAQGLVLLGRRKDMILRGGVNIYPPLIEPQISALTDRSGRPLVRACALIGVWDPARQDERVVLWYTPAADIDTAELQARVTPITGTDAAPDHYFPTEELPVIGRQNKLDREALRAQAAAKIGLHADIPAPGRR